MTEIVYEVNVDVATDRAEEFIAWLLPHVDEMLAFDGFLRAQVFDREVLGEGDVSLRGFTVHYTVRDRAALDTYFTDHAAAMRGDGVNRFGDSFRAWRHVLSVHKERS